MFMMDSCDKVINQASDYLDGNMSFSKRLKMRLHIMMCRHCCNFVHQLKITIATIKGLNTEGKISDDEVDKQVEKLLKNGNQAKNKE